MTNLKHALESRINNWYYNARLDYGVSGKFIEAEAKGNDLLITWEEEGERQEATIAWYKEYTAEQLYNIWMEIA